MWSWRLRIRSAQCCCRFAAWTVSASRACSIELYCAESGRSVCAYFDTKTCSGCELMELCPYRCTRDCRLDTNASTFADILSARKVSCASIGCVDCARKAMSANFYTNTISHECQNVSSTQNTVRLCSSLLVSEHIMLSQMRATTRTVHFDISILKVASRTVHGMIEDSAGMVRHFYPSRLL